MRTELRVPANPISHYLLMPRKPTIPTTPTKAEKRRGPPLTPLAAPAGSRSPSRAMRTATSSSSSASPNARPGPGPGAVVIAAPPRAALSGTSSPAPPDLDYRNRGPGDSNTTSSGKDTPRSGTINNSNNNSPPTTTPETTSSDHPHTLHHLLAQKEARIAHLERELAIMESEFTRELDKLATSESETSTFWQSKYSTLNQQFLRVDTELRLLRSERDSERDEFRGRYEVLAREIRERDEDIRGLRAQIRGLKEWVSTSTRADGVVQTSDEVFGEGMARLGNGLQNWVLVWFRRVRLDLSKADEDILAELGRLVPMYEDLASTSKVNLIQSLVSRLLVEFVFDAYFVGLSTEQAHQFTQMETFLSSFATSPEPINQWRSMTLNILKKEADQRMQKETASVADKIVSKANTVLAAVTDTKATEARDQGLKALVSSSIELSRLLVVQRAVFKVTMPEILPHQKIMFEPSTMEDIGGEDEDSLEEREICCVTFPGIIKRGDESGGHLQYRNVISKARVLCSPE